MDFTTLTFDTTSRLFTDTDANHKRIAAFIDDNDYWQQGREYVGPLPAITDIAGQELLRRSFTPLPKLGETLHRHVRGVVGREPAFEIVLNPENQTLSEQIDEAQGAWWDAANAHELVHKFALQLRSYGKAYLRYDIPPGLLTDGVDDTGQPARGASFQDWPTALNNIYVDVPPVGSAAVYVDPTTRAKLALYRYEEEIEGAMNVTTRMNEKVRCIQLSFLDSEGRTVVRVLRERSKGGALEVEDDEARVYDLGGNLLVVGAEMRPLITDAVIEMQNKLNAVSTMIKINADVAGFPERTHLDVEPPAVPITNPNTGEISRQAAPLPTGPRTVQHLFSYPERDDRGQPVTDDKGAPVVRRGQIIFRQPVSSQPLREDARFLMEGIYTATQQLHVLISGDATASGVSRVEARADFADSLLETKPKVEGVLRSLLHGALCWAAHLAPGAGVLETFKAARVRVDCQLNAGPLSPDEKRELLERYNAGTLSLETYLALVGIEDVMAELEKIEQDGERRSQQGLSEVFRNADDDDEAAQQEPVQEQQAEAA